MIFTQLPEQFASIQGNLLYRFTGVSTTETFLTILNVRNGAVLGSKRFYKTTQGITDIAPMIRKSIRFIPSTGLTGVCDSNSRTVRVQLSGDSTFSLARTFIAARRNATPPEILTTMPHRRIIPRGASDEITCCIPAEHTISVTTDLSGLPIEFVVAAGQDLTVFRLDTRSLPISVGSVSVRFSTAGQIVGQIDYLVTPSLEGGRRLAWRSSMGSIEHYTFPVVKSIVQHIKKEQIYTAEGGCTDTEIRREQITTLTSAFESTAVIEALSEIAASPQVWLVNGADEYQEVNVLPSEQTLRRHGSLCCVEVSLRPKLNLRPL